MPDNKESNKSTSNNVLKTVAAVALGAAVAFGAYFIGRSEGQDEAKSNYQERINVAKNMTPKCSNNLPKVPIDNDIDAKDCSICKRSWKEVMDADEEIHSTQCGHIFCKNCIDGAIEFRPKCPICNTEVLFNQTHRIFL